MSAQPKRNYNEKLENINNWVYITNHHWERLKGDFYNDEQFWDDSLHAMADDPVWWDWVETEPALRAQHPQAFSRYPFIQQATDHITRATMYGKPLVKKGVKNANFNTFRAWMNIKDVMNEINGTPTVQYPKPVNIAQLPPKKQAAHKKQAKLNAKSEIFNSLFNTGE